MGGSDVTPKTVWLAPILLSVSACAAAGPVPTPDACVWARPIWLHPDDHLTDRTETAILVHNETWVAVCAGQAETPMPDRLGLDPEQPTG